MEDAGRNDALEAFRAEARAWIEAELPPSLKGRPLAMGEVEPTGNPDFRRWKSEVCAMGWGVPTLPVAYAGAGLSPAEARVLREEMRRAGAWNPIALMMGVRMLGPTLLEFGSEAQKRDHLPPIARGERRWCQGFSEPGAGSDLASLQTRCEDRGDHWLVNGQKIWTSGADRADWCFCLVRTDPTQKQAGISFLLIDMKTPGVEVRPIRLISGNSPFCETFFTDVKVPKENLVGPLNGGWTIAKRLLQYERQRNEDAPVRTSEPRSLETVALAYLGREADGRLAGGELRARIAAHDMDQRALVLTVARVAAESAAGGPSATTSVLKNASSMISQQRAELLVEIMGAQGLGWEGDDFAPAELAAVREWLSGKATTIYAGSYEIQNNIIAKRILGLPDA
jgi:alkylation response protein AidB-like acyl-CoA dehydrogenase